MEVLRVKNLVKRFGSNLALDNVTFSVQSGEFCVLVGPSGSGKSTLLQIIAGLEKASHGEILIEGKSVAPLAPRERDIAMVFQSYALYPHMTAFENMAFPLRIGGMSKQKRRERVREGARLLAIEELLDRYPRELSGGQRQRVAIGRAIVRRPKLFLFDEPLSNLDARLRVKMRAELAGLHKKLGTTIVYVTHDQIEAMTLGSKLIILDEGKVQQKGGPTQIYMAPKNLFVATFIGSPEMNLLEGRIDEPRTELFHADRITIPLPVKLPVGSLSLGIRPEDLSAEETQDGISVGAMEISLIENLGSEKLVHLQSAGRSFVMRSDVDQDLEEGMTVELFANPKNLHFFREGKRIDILR